MPELYPIRKFDMEKISNELQDVCRCGHVKHMHETDEPRSCELCGCPQYVFEQQLTRHDVLQLRLKLDMEAEKQGFTQ